MKQVIGITGNESQNNDLTFLESRVKRTFASKVFSDVIIEAGGLPFVLPISDKDLAKDYVSRIDKLLITGGQNVEPHYYGKDKEIISSDYHDNRDQFEIALIKEAIKQKKPIFGICRGLQIINVTLGGTIKQEVKGHWQREANDVASHDIAIKEDSILATFYGKSTSVNSFHRQAVDQLGTDLEWISKGSDDGIIEAVVGKKLPILGVQWHPELTLKKNKADQALFHFIVNQFA